MPLHLHLVPLAGFAGLMLMAAFEDFRRLAIPNRVILGLCATPPLLIAAAVLGGLSTLVRLSPVGRLIIATRRPVFRPAAATRANPVLAPYGVAIATAALIVTIPPNFS